MSRKKIEANQKIFAALDDICKSEDEPLSNSGIPRWIDSSDDKDDFLTHSKIVSKIWFTPNKGALSFHYEDILYIFLIGFEDIDTNSITETLSETEISGGMATVALYESEIKPKGSIASIRNVIEVYDQRDSEYKGHRWEEIEEIYPKIMCFEAHDIDKDEVEKAYYVLCISHLISTESWIDENISSQLLTLCRLNLNELPYKTLCRSIFDTDRSSLFLSLYRCVEAIYAFESAKKISNSLTLDHDWTEIAIALEDNLGWRPHEENSLSGLLKHSNEFTAEKILLSLGLKNESKDIINFAAKKVYKLRNALVHYRPAHQSLNFDEIDWTCLCSCMIDVVFDIYYHVFGSKIDDHNRGHA